MIATALETLYERSWTGPMLFSILLKVTFTSIKYLLSQKPWSTLCAKSRPSYL